MRDLTKIEPLQSIDDELIDEINRSSQIKKFEKNSSLFDNEETKEKFYIVLSGLVKVYQTNPLNAREQTIQLLKQGDMFDVIPLLDGKNHDVLASVIDDAELLELPIDKVREWIRTKPQFNKVFYPYLAKCLRNMEELAVDISLYDTSTRLMKLLLKNIDISKSVKEIKLLHKLSHEDIASLIGSVRAVVNRHLQQLKKEGILDIGRKMIAVNDVNKLLKKVEDSYA